MKTIEVEKLSPGHSQPFCIAFVYSNRGNCVVKGFLLNVENYIRLNFSHSFYYMTYWRNGKCRGVWTTDLSSPLKLVRRQIGNRCKYVFYIKKQPGTAQEILTVRNVPRKWLPVLEKAFQY